MTAFRIAACAGALAVLAGCTASVPRPPPAAAPAKPDLVVMVAVDQYSAALFNRWRSQYRDGLARLQREGIVYDNAYQTHGLTETCPGHSTLLTGKTPAHTGIVGNSWYDGVAGKAVYCLAAPDYRDARGDPKAPRVGPTNLVASTLGDWLKQASPGSRVVAVAGKDRAAITLGGHRADAAFWYIDGFGFTTYAAPGEDAAAKLAPLAALNAKVQQAYVPPPAWTYRHDACRALEASYRIGGADWQSGLPPMLPAKPGEAPKPARALQIMDPLTLEAAFTLIEHYKLGRRGATDLLAISFSATDFVGHGYGTAGPEMCEQMYRLDGLMGRLLARLESLGVRVLLALSADHGGTDFPERLARQGYPQARRIDGKALLAGVNAQLRGRLGLAHDPLASPDLMQLYAVDAAGRQLAEPQRARVVEAALEILRAQPEVAAAYALQELLAHHPRGVDPELMTLRDRFAQSAMAGRSGDIVLAYQPGITVAPARLTSYIEGHSGPYDLDRRVPIVFWWPGAPAQTRILPVATTDIAPTLAHIVGIGAPADLDGRCLDLADFDSGAGAGACPVAAGAPPRP